MCIDISCDICRGVVRYVFAFKCADFAYLYFSRSLYLYLMFVFGIFDLFENERLGS